MPRLSAWFIRASMLYLLAGFTLGALMLAQEGISYDPHILSALPVHFEFLLAGWLVQLAMGMAFWIFPRFGMGLPHSRGNLALMWSSFGLLNAGICLAALQLWLPLALLIGRVSEAAAVILYAAGTWRRVKPHGSQGKVDG